MIFFQVVQIEIALLSQKPSGVRKLKELAASEGGLINDDLRRRVWPKLLNIDMVTFLVLDDMIIINHLRTYYTKMAAHCKCSSD
jgi:hypothetical protein